MSILSNYIIQDLIQNIILMKFLPIHYILMTIVHIWGGLLTLFLTTK